MRRTKGFTLVELLVVIAIIALLMGILMPALARVRQIAFRMMCGTNLSSIGKAMLIYANEYEDELPRAGWSNSILEAGGFIEDWTGGYPSTTNPRAAAFGGPPPAASSATITSCFYVLIKYADATPKIFVCKSGGATEFKLSEHTDLTGFELIDAWDFGENEQGEGDSPDNHCSYCYHDPFYHPTTATGGTYPLSVTGDPRMAVAADRNPWIPPNERSDADWLEFGQGLKQKNSQMQKKGNTVAHQDDGQNVLFLDGHVNFEKYSYCGASDDNIYTHISVQPRLGERDFTKGPYKETGQSTSMDSMLINNRAGQ